MPVTANHRPAAATTASAVVIQAVCEVLDLTLGPLDLNLLGLEIHLDTVHLDIDANPAGGLLGQLLSGLLCGSDLNGIFANLHHTRDVPELGAAGCGRHPGRNLDA
jgi:hypothetical protein